MAMSSVQHFEQHHPHAMQPDGGCVLLANRKSILCDGVIAEAGQGRLASARAEGLLRAVRAIEAADVERAFLDVWSSYSPSEGIVAAFGVGNHEGNLTVH